MPCRFNSPTSFEPTREVAVFDLLGIPLVHGWLVDPQDAEATRCLGGRSYNQVGEWVNG
jgi:ubiquitin carboxyl-terminal hydrolase MINDY-1/2